MRFILPSIVNIFHPAFAKDFLHPFIVACHSAEDAEERRKKRQTNVIDADNTRILRQYFTNCLTAEVGFP